MTTKETKTQPAQKISEVLAQIIFSVGVGLNIYESQKIPPAIKKSK